MRSESNFIVRMRTESNFDFSEGDKHSLKNALETLETLATCCCLLKHS